MKLILTSLLLFTVASQGQTYWLLDKNTDGIGSKPKVTAANSTIFGINSSGVLELLPQSTFAPVSTTVTLAGTQTISGKKTFSESTQSFATTSGNFSTSNGGFFAITGGFTSSDGDFGTTNGGFFSTNGNFQTEFGQFTGSGAGLTNLPAASLTGDIARARINSALSANAAPVVATTITGTTGTFSGAVTLPAGTAAAPSINFGNAGTGIHQQTTDRIGFTAAGTTRVVVYSSGMYMASGAFGVNGLNWFRIGTSGASTGLTELATTAGGGTFAPLFLSNLTASGNVICSTVGNGLQVKGGSALARAGNATLVAGTITVNNTTVTANTVIILTRKTSGGTIGMAVTYTLSTGASFTITSDSALDTSTYSFLLLEVNP